MTKRCQDRFAGDRCELPSEHDGVHRHKAHTWAFAPDGVCRRCGGDISARFAGPVRIWAHRLPRFDLNHAPVPKP